MMESTPVQSIPLGMIIFFVAMLAAIATFPLFAEHWWHHNRNKLIVSVVLSVPVLIFLLAEGMYAPIEHAAEEYFAFIVLLGALFIISGGILVEGDIRATPMVNTSFLALGALLASFMGTTGASMLLIRPLLRTNSERKFTLHTPIFFIFLVSNAGGLLTPLGDPPLFLGYLRGVPFTWTFGLWKEWLFVSAVLLAIYFVLDTRSYTKERPLDIAIDRRRVQPLKVSGTLNLLWLLGIVLAVAFLNEKYIGTAAHYFAREWVMIGLAGLSWFLTPKLLREKQNFSFGPIVEVAVLFIGIFVTMIPALILLEEKGGELGLTQPWQFFLATGFLSSFLDNAPTYLSFFSMAQGASAELGALYPAVEMIQHIPSNILRGISLGSVLMGAMTYIGNGPNFMVKAIAEENGIEMPSFGGYIKWTLVVLLPIWVAVTVLFLL
ncbi:sodium:proton antiporter [Candidatus Woesebacteria bacterium]|nr:sodium:proton antiporter [Candidatus Woesebacteria bacterium]